ncbi:zinc ribbon domain-containing protein [Scandinavium sp.]|uniref:zinc ribbon domain-containing protein n=1 Tax=Scandinavium sp. TaxID=2830653 RepID=UPI0028974C82|nr:zinc ribbon domain-containing protein [Scandinavium sp.]
MALNCPVCHGALEQQSGQGHCAYCQQDFALQALCPECHKPLEVLKACGAVDYFCQNGHGLISKKRVEFKLV